MNPRAADLEAFFTTARAWLYRLMLSRCEQLLVMAISSAKASASRRSCYAAARKRVPVDVLWQHRSENGFRLADGFCSVTYEDREALAFLFARCGPLHVKQISPMSI